MEGYIAEIRMFGGNFAPRNWAFCDGQLLPISSYTALFSLLGTIWGGDGRTTFALPDFRGRSPISPGQGPGLPSYNVGAKGGAATTTLTTGNLPAHNHTASTVVTARAMPNEGDSAVPTDRTWAKSGMGDPDYAPPVSGSTVDLHPDALNASTTVGNTGSGQSFNNMHPYAACYYIICLFGIFPSRN
ncbi:MAG: phage tail protein [Phycisphaerales bacterium JB040]